MLACFFFCYLFFPPFPPNESIFGHFATSSTILNPFPLKCEGLLQLHPTEGPAPGSAPAMPQDGVSLFICFLPRSFICFLPHLFVSFPVRLFVSFSVCLFVSFPIRLFPSLFVYLFPSPFIYLFPFPFICFLPRSFVSPFPCHARCFAAW